jgi:hypothetical protein
MLNRRQLLRAASTSLLLAAPRAARAQQMGKVSRIGLLRVGPPPPSFIEPGSLTWP